MGRTFRVFEVAVCARKGGQGCDARWNLGRDAATHLMPKKIAYSVVSGSRSLDWLRNVATTTNGRCQHASSHHKPRQFTLSNEVNFFDRTWPQTEVRACTRLLLMQV